MALNFELGWIDLTSVSVLLVFGIMGLFRGFLWQTSRVACLVIGYILATVFAHDVAGVLESTTVVEGRVAVYSAYMLIFISVLLLLNFVTLLLDRMIRKLELTFYDRLGGGVLGVATGGAAVVAFVGVLYLITPKAAPVVTEVRASHTGRFSSLVASWLPFPRDIAALYTGPAEKAEGEPGTGPEHRLEAPLPSAQDQLGPGFEHAGRADGQSTAPPPARRDGDDAGVDGRSGLGGRSDTGQKPPPTGPNKRKVDGRKTSRKL